MNCYYHSDQIAVAQCTDCGKGLCKDCASIYEIPICDSCNKKRISNEEKHLINELLFIGIGGAVLTCLMSILMNNSHHPVNGDTSITHYLILFYMFSGAIAGWQTLTKITSSMFISMSFVGWGIYFFVKAILAIFVGLIMLPVKIIRNIYQLRQLKNINPNG